MKRNRNETKRNEINENETKRNETKMKRNKNETKRNQRNENEIENGRKNNRNQTYFHNYDARPLPTHVCLSSGEDRICHH